MDTLEKIEKELREISKWPWAEDYDDRPGMQWNIHITCSEPCSQGDCGLTVCFMAHDGTKENTAGFANATFIALAPERIAALVEYVRANEAYSAALSRPGSSLPECHLLRIKLEAARAKLGLK